MRCIPLRILDNRLHRILEGRCLQRPLQFGSFLACVFQSPEGRKQNSPGRLGCAMARPYLETGCRDVRPRRAQSSRFAESGLQPWERDAQRNRPERPSESDLARNEEYAVTIFDGPVSFAPNCTRRLPQEVPSSCLLEITSGDRPPLQGHSLSVRLPRAEAPGLFCFHPSGDGEISKLKRELQAAPLQNHDHYRFFSRTNK